MSSIPQYLSILLFFLFLGTSSCSPAPPSNLHPAQALLNNAIAYLLEQQASDGGWHSETHGILRGGQALSPFILSTLLEMPELIPEDALERGIGFIRRHVREDGALGFANPMVLEYPNYSTAYALLAVSRYGTNEDSSLIRRMQQYLIGQQFDESRSIENTHKAYGGWGFGETTLADGQVGHVDLSHTRRILEALRISGVRDSTMYRSASLFLQRIQEKAGAPEELLDGGFYYSPVVTGANKGGVVKSLESADVYGSYSSATCDGILALLASGHDPGENNIGRAVAWLDAHPALDYPEGIPQDQPAQWHRAIFFYHLAVRAEVYNRIGWPEGVREEIVTLLESRVSPDGSFVNPAGTPNKENDPLLATTLAIQVLLRTLPSD